MLETAATAVLAFASTNVDDLFLLMIWFTQVPHTLAGRNILGGQYLGILTLVAISLVGSLLGLVVPAMYMGLLGLFPVYLGVMKFVRSGEEEPADEQPRRHIQANGLLGYFFSGSTLTVASVTLANGADNIGVYIPLFAALSAVHIIATVGIFIAMVWMWVVAARYMVSHPRLKSMLSRYSNRVFPWILIGLGVYIIIENGSLALIKGF